jgi:hypothetical protein
MGLYQMCVLVNGTFSLKAAINHLSFLKFINYFMLSDHIHQALHTPENFSAIQLLKNLSATGEYKLSLYHRNLSGSHNILERILMMVHGVQD